MLQDLEVSKLYSIRGTGTLLLKYTSTRNANLFHGSDCGQGQRSSTLLHEVKVGPCLAVAMGPVLNTVATSFQ